MLLKKFKFAFTIGSMVAQVGGATVLAQDCKNKNSSPIIEALQVQNDPIATASGIKVIAYALQNLDENHGLSKIYYVHDEKGQKISLSDLPKKLPEHLTAVRDTKNPMTMTVYNTDDGDTKKIAFKVFSLHAGIVQIAYWRVGRKEDICVLQIDPSEPKSLNQNAFAKRLGSTLRNF